MRSRTHTCTPPTRYTLRVKFASRVLQLKCINQRRKRQLRETHELTRNERDDEKFIDGIFAAGLGGQRVYALLSLYEIFKLRLLSGNIVRKKN